MHLVKLALGLTLVSSSLASRPADSASFTVIDQFPAGVLGITRAASLSADGSTVVGDARTSERRTAAFVWNATSGLRLIEGLPDDSTNPVESRAGDVSADGKRVLGGSTSGIFIWDEATGARIVEPLPTPPASLLVGGLSDDGSTFVGLRGDDQAFTNPEAFVWNESDGLRGLSQLPGGRANTGGAAVSADGTRLDLLATDESGAGEASIWDAANGIRGLGDLNGGEFASSPFAISSDGSTVVGFGTIEPNQPGIDTGRRAMIADEVNGMRALGSLFEGRYDSVALGVSADGSVVVGTDNYPAPGGGRFSGRPFSKAFIWDAQNGMRALDVLLSSLGIDLTGWELVDATSISADGRTVLGQAIDPNGQLQTFVAVIPEPGTGLLIGVGIALLASRSGRQRGGAGECRRTLRMER